MARVEEPGQDPVRVAGRGREDVTPAYLQTAVLVTVAVVVLVVVGLVFLAMALA